MILPLYPNINKTAIFDERGSLLQGPVILKINAGPGRIVSSSEIVLAKRKALFEKGLIILLGLPNATSAQQEMDALYGPFKSATYSCGKKVVQQKLKARGLARRDGQQLSSAVPNLNCEDLPTIVNGTTTDVVVDKPFDLSLHKEQEPLVVGKGWFRSLNMKLVVEVKGQKGAWTTLQGCSTRGLTVSIRFAS